MKALGALMPKRLGENPAVNAGNTGKSIVMELCTYFYSGSIVATVAAEVAVVTRG